jgi:hypothetical protein
MATLTLDYLNQSFTMGVSGDIDDFNVTDITDISATAQLTMTVAEAKAVFRYWTDASDITNAEADDIIYYVKMTEWPDDISNVCHANLVASSGAIGGDSFDANKSMVTHDFIRYLAEKLFNTHLGVDLFNNEEAMRDDLYAKGRTAWEAIDASLGAANGMTNTTTSNANITRQLMGQLMDASASRFSTLEATDASGTRALPFVENDIIEFKLTINAADNQHALTGVSAIPARPYRIQIKLIADSNTGHHNVVDDE